MKPTTLFSIFCAALAVALTASGPTGQGAPGVETATLTAELAGINRSLQEVVALTRQQVEHQQTDFLMKRIEIESRGLEPLETALRAARNERENLGQERDQITIMRDQAERRLQDQASEGGIADPAATRMREEIDMRLKMLENRIWEVDQKILDLEQDLREASRMIDMWKETIDTQLGLR